MNNQLLSQLTHQDPHQRRQAIIALGKSGNPAALEPLQQVYKSDPDPAVRELAAKAGYHIKALQAQAPKKASLTPEEIEAINLKKASQRPAKKEKNPANYILNLLIFLMVLVILIGSGVLYWLFNTETGEALLWQLRMPEPQSLGNPQLNAGNLNGVLWEGRISSKTTYMIQEPNGTPPPEGWPLLVGVHGSGGSAEDALFWAREAKDRGVLVVAPTFSPESPGSNEYLHADTFPDLLLILRDIEQRYPIDPDVRVLFGFSMGGGFTGSFTATYVEEFTGGGIFGPRSVQQPPSWSPVQYVVSTGTSDSRINAATDFVAAMEQRGTPVWKSYFPEGRGHVIKDDQIDLVYELIDQLRQ